MKKPKIGLMLGGGGAKGAYQVGVLRALEEAKLLKHVKVISGTSIGAINTLLLLSKDNHKRISAIWNYMDNEGIYGEGVRFFDKKRYGLYSLDSLYQTLCKEISLKKVRKSRYIGYATAAQVFGKGSSFIEQLSPSVMQKQVFKLNTYEKPYRAVLASASIPVLFGSTLIDGMPYVDGGMLDNYPIEPLILEECKVIFAIPIDTKFKADDYKNLDIPIIDFTPKSVFSKNMVTDFLEALKFVQESKDEKYELGYFVGKMMIQKLYQEHYLKKRFFGTKFLFESRFMNISLNKDEEALVKTYKIELKKEK